VYRIADRVKLSSVNKTLKRFNLIPHLFVSSKIIDNNEFRIYSDYLRKFYPIYIHVLTNIQKANVLIFETSVSETVHVHFVSLTRKVFFLKISWKMYH